MMEEASFGIIPLRKSEGEWEVLLIQHHAGHWGFPKGHPNLKETHLESAQRELLEETGLEISHLISNEPFVDIYRFTRKGKPVTKQVSYFVAQVKGNLMLQPEEIKAAKWMPLMEVSRFIVFPSARIICNQVIQLLDRKTTT